ncbi:uncharacterized protein LOC119973865 isoform X2 [Scyliorhinus canicula]|uniref:uncharacterized protein LOC119973865 isoform X2 n=1 Tax=Scyliorhinus canicula TaxID=7830 RepID=UPI0018F2968E|nr:uncharacterized protein LOC119973865 isoform X2 [Scyliorhinus canicula]
MPALDWGEHSKKSYNTRLNPTDIESGTFHSVPSSMQSDGDLQEIELHVVESINDLHRTTSNLEVTKSYSGQIRSRPSTIFIAQEAPANGLVTAPLLDPRQREPIFSQLVGSVRETRDRCECSCICCHTTSCDKVFYAVLITLVLVSIAIGIFTVYYSGRRTFRRGVSPARSIQQDQAALMQSLGRWLANSPFTLRAELHKGMEEEVSTAAYGAEDLGSNPGPGKNQQTTLGDFLPVGFLGSECETDSAQHF